MTNWSRLTLLLLLLLANGANVFAQQSQPAPVPEPDETAATNPDPAGAVAATEESTTPPTIVPDSAADTVPAGEYRASEQISEDLSVSYPVDI